MNTLQRSAHSPRIAFSVRGSGDAVVFLHGIGGNRANWNLQLAALSANFKCVALDFRGYGDSDDAEGDLAFFDFVDDTRLILDELEIENCHLVGHSMGGLVAQGFYLRYPERVRSLSLIACRPGSAPVFEDSKKFAEERSAPLRAGDQLTLAESLMPRLLGLEVDDRARADIRESLLKLRPASYVKVLKARLEIEPFLRLAEIAVPTLVVGATHDQVAPLDQMASMAAAIPGSQFRVIEGAGHLSNIEKPALFNDIALAFLLHLARDEPRLTPR